MATTSKSRRRKTADPAFLASTGGRGKTSLRTIIDHRQLLDDAGNVAGEEPVTIGDHVIATLRGGGYVETAAARAGIAKSTLLDWLRTGMRVRQRLEAGTPKRNFTDNELLFAEFSRAVDEAKAEAETRDLHLHRQVAHGELTREIITTKTAPDGEVTRTVVREPYAPDPRSLEWRLSRRHPGKWGAHDRLELSGPDGEDIPISVRAKALAEDIRKAREAQETAAGDAG